MQRSITVLIAGSIVLGVAASAQATGTRTNERFGNAVPLEQITRSRTDAAEAAAQVPGAAAVLLEALRWRGSSARELGLPAKLWCADFMNFVLRKAGGKGTHSRAARSFLNFGKKLDGPRVGAIAVLTRGRKGGHVGVVSGVDADGNPIIISGNHTPKGVGEGVYARSRVIAYVVPKERRTIAQNARAAGPSIESPFAELIAAMKTEQARAQRPQPAAPAAPVVRRAAPHVVPHRTVQQTPDQRANNGATNPLSELMGSLERAPVRQRVL
jgi:uncharacterized protein (TIGR02594 family)